MATIGYDMLTFSGVIGTVAAPVEIWSWSVKFAVEGANSSMVAKANRGSAAYTSHLITLFHQETVLTKVRASRHVARGRVETDQQGAYIQGDNVDQVAGQFPVQRRYPLQTACVVSLITDRPGVTGKGRCFLPAPAIDLGVDYRWGDGQVNSIAQQFREFLLDVSSRGTEDPDNPTGFSMGPPIVASGGNKGNGYQGYNTDVRRIRVGRVPDTQRSRRNDLAEDYALRTL